MKRPQRACSFSHFHVRTQREGDHLEARESSHQKSNYAGIRISDIQPLELWEKFFCCLGHLVHGIVMAVQA